VAGVRTLTVLVFGVYLAAATLAGTLLDRGPLPEVVGAALVAVGLTPMRDRRSAADRLIYGARRDPLQALTRLGQRVAATPEMELLPTALTRVAAAVRAPGVVVTAPNAQIVARIGTVQSETLPAALSSRSRCSASPARWC
jgi:hypothetical protein